MTGQAIRSRSAWNNLLGYLNTHWTNANWETLDPSPTGTYNQQLATVPVPAPIVGAGLPGLMAACGDFSFSRGVGERGSFNPIQSTVPAIAAQAFSSVGSRGQVARSQ
jgi:hypothetical protein